MAQDDGGRKLHYLMQPLTLLETDGDGQVELMAMPADQLGAHRLTTDMALSKQIAPRLADPQLFSSVMSNVVALLAARRAGVPGSEGGPVTFDLLCSFLERWEPVFSDSEAELAAKDARSRRGDAATGGGSEGENPIGS